MHMAKEMGQLKLSKHGVEPDRGARQWQDGAFGDAFHAMLSIQRSKTSRLLTNFHRNRRIRTMQAR